MPPPVKRALHFGFNCKRPFIHAAFSVDASAGPVGRHRHGRSSSIRLMGWSAMRARMSAR